MQSDAKIELYEFIAAGCAVLLLISLVGFAYRDSKQCEGIDTTHTEYEQCAKRYPKLVQAQEPAL